MFKFEVRDRIHDNIAKLRNQSQDDEDDKTEQDKDKIERHDFQ